MKFSLFWFIRVLSFHTKPFTLTFLTVKLENMEVLCTAGSSICSLVSLLSSNMDNYLKVVFFISINKQMYELLPGSKLSQSWPCKHLQKSMEASCFASSHKIQSAEVERPTDGGHDTKRRECRCQRRREQMISSLPDFFNPTICTVLHENMSRTSERLLNDI